jgi:hypothetical protein
VALWEKRIGQLRPVSAVFGRSQKKDGRGENAASGERKNGPVEFAKAIAWFDTRPGDSS